jgi:hypothetical protein
MWEIKVRMDKEKITKAKVNTLEDLKKVFEGLEDKFR